MSLKDKLDIGLEPDAPYRRENLPEQQQDSEACEEGGAPTDDERARLAREACDAGEGMAPPSASGPAPESGDHAEGPEAGVRPTAETEAHERRRDPRQHETDRRARGAGKPVN